MICLAEHRKLRQAGPAVQKTMSKIWKGKELISLKGSISRRYIEV